jgi:hypothetical protein
MASFTHIPFEQTHAKYHIGITINTTCTTLRCAIDKIRFWGKEKKKKKKIDIKNKK